MALPFTEQEIWNRVLDAGQLHIVSANTNVGDSHTYSEQQVLNQVFDPALNRLKGV